MQLSSKAMLLILVTAVFSSSMGTVQPVQAASACEGEAAVPDWNTTAQRLALVPFSNWVGPYMYEDIYYEEDNEGDTKQQSGYGDEWDPVLHPEEQWMYNPIRPLPVLEPLTTGQYATLQIGNDSSGMLRFNLFKYPPNHVLCIAVRTGRQSNGACSGRCLPHDDRSVQFLRRGLSHDARRMVVARLGCCRRRF